MMKGADEQGQKPCARVMAEWPRDVRFEFAQAKTKGQTDLWSKIPHTESCTTSSDDPINITTLDAFHHRILNGRNLVRDDQVMWT